MFASTNRTIIHGLLLSMLIFTAGCPTERASDIGTNHVAVLSVTRWDDYQAALQPKFDLSAGQALATAMPDTLQLQLAMQHSFDADVALRLAPSAVLPAGFGSGQSGANFSPSATQPATAAPATSQPASVLNPSSLGTDAQLQYLAATALYQEVKLINRYVHDAAIPNNYRAYIVRSQISSMPKRRNSAFDTYVDLSMFLNPVNQPVNLTPVQNAMQFASVRLKSVIGDLTAAGQTTSLEDAHAANLLKIVQSWYDQVAATTQPATRSSDNGTQPTAEEKNAADVIRLRNLQHDIRVKLRQVRNTRRDPSTRKGAEKPERQNPTTQGEDPEHAPPLPPDGSWTETAQPFASVASELEALEDLAQDIQDNLDRQEEHHRLPIIVPLLVTDEVEGALAARRADDLQRLALSLSAAYAGVGGNLNVADVEQAMRSAVGRDYNSLLSVGRVNDNTLRVRIGARLTSAFSTQAGWVSPAKQAENYRALAQTHNVSFLVLLPASSVVSHPTNVYFGTHSKFVDVYSGKTVPDDDQSNATLTSRLATRFGGDYDAIYAGRQSTPNRIDLESLASSAQNSDYSGFTETLRSRGDFNIGRANLLWLKLSEERITSAFDGGHFQAPQYPAASPVRTEQTVVLTDDGTQTTGTVGGDFGRYDVRPMHAAWVVTWQPTDGARPKSLPSNLTLVGHAEITGGQLTLAFPSLKAANVKVLASTLIVTHPNGGPLVITGEPVYAVQATSVAKLLGTFTITRAKLAPDAKRLDTPTIVVSFSDQFVAQLASLPAVTVGDNTRFPTLTVDGAEVELPLPGGLVEDTKNKGTYRVTQPGSFQLSLGGLVPGTDVTFSIVSPNAQFKASDPKVLKVGDFPPVPK